MNIRALLYALLLLPAAIAGAAPPQTGVVPATTEPPPPPPRADPENDRPCWADRNDPAIPCRPGPHPYRRPLILAPAPPPPEDTAPPEPDRDGCRQEKLRQLNALHYGDTQRANRIDEWLWKNCRSYSNELRQLEQDAM